MKGLIKSILGIPKSKTLAGILRERGWLAIVVTTLAVSLAAFHLFTSYAGVLEALRHRSIHLVLMLMIVFLGSSLRSRHKWYLALNIMLVLLAGITGVYVYTQSIEIPLRLGNPNQWDILFGCIIILLTLEAARRVVSWFISVLAIIFLLYTYYGPLFPGFLKHAPYSIEEIINAQFLDMPGLWGIPLGVMSTYIIIFLIFAGLLFQTGMASTFIDLANKLLGRATGGPAKVAVASSTLVGSISGSAVANVLVTGTVSIPTMKRLGYRPYFAGAVEAGVSTGGQFMPPIMGAAAFIIAAFLGIAYIQVCKAALLPALLWFFSFFVIVHLEAKKLGLKALSKEEVGLITWSSIVKRLYLFIPLIILIYLLVKGYSPMLAGFWASMFVIALSFIRKETRFTLGSLVAGLERGINTAVPVSIACATAGIIVGGVVQSGLGYTLSASLVKISGGELFVLLPLVLIASLILGMGMTTTPAYIIVAILVVPALIKIGVVPIAAHLFPFYFAIISSITPPVALASYAAAGLALASPWRTGIEGVRLALPAISIAFIFVIRPNLLLIGDPLSILITLATVVMGIICLASTVSGYLLRRLKIFERISLFAIAVMFFHPDGVINLIGLGLLGISILIQKRFAVP